LSVGSDSPQVLHEDNHLLVLEKPAGLPTMGASAGQPSLVTWAKSYLKDKYHKPGNVYVGVVSRLDSLVSGLVVLARTSKAAGRLSEQFREGEVDKEYLALVEGHVDPPSAELVDWLRHDEPSRRVHVTVPSASGAKEARLTYERLGMVRDTSLLRVTLHTGRKHQIRVQLADCGHPLLGDEKYGSRRSFPHGIALHAARLAIRHPVRDEILRFESQPPSVWRKFMTAAS
jgi:23S rRNA pseudouridine1911/1915/1917 synthase